MTAPTLQDDEDVIDLRALLARLMAKRWWIIASVVLFTAAFAAAAFVMTPVYRATTILVPANTGQGSDILASAVGQLGGLASLAGINVGARGPETEEALAVLRSRQFTERFISDKQLMPKLFARKWDEQSGTWKGTAPTPARAYRYFNEKVRSVVQDKKTGLITVHVEWRDRNDAAAWANELVERMNQEMRARAIANADASLGFLQRELQNTSAVTVREAVSRLIEAQVKQRMVANVTQEYAFRIVDQAMPPDADNPVRPQKAKMIATGFLVGLTLSVLFVLFSGGPRSRAEQP